MKNENQFLFQNGMSWIISALLIKNNKGTIGEPVKPSKYMTKNESTGFWYFNKDLWVKENFPKDTSPYKQTQYYILVPSRVIYSYLRAPYNAIESNYYTIIYFESYYRSYPGPSASSTNLNFNSSMTISFENLNAALTALLKGGLDNCDIYSPSSSSHDISIEVKHDTETGGNRLFDTWYNANGTVRFVNNIKPYYSNYSIPGFNKDSGYTNGLPINNYVGG